MEVLSDFINLVQILWTGDYLGYARTLGLEEDSSLVSTLLTIHEIIF